MAEGDDLAGEPDATTVRVAARAGLVGNPSDGYGGAVLAAPLPMLAATVTARASVALGFRGDAGEASWPSLGAWCDEVEGRGHGDDQRIISASLWTLVDHLRQRGVAHDGAEIAWTTDVPRSVGLAGSSALAVGVIGATAGAWGVVVDPRLVASLALRAEREVLGIAAGWQDRIVQSHGTTVLVDASVMDDVEEHSVPTVRELRWRGGTSASLVVGWSSASSESSDSYHAPLRRSAETLAAPMGVLADLARSAAGAWSRGDFESVAAAMGEGWRTRQACAPLRADHTDLVESVRALGVAATTPGSGGSVVALCRDDAEAELVERMLVAAGRSVRRTALS